MYDWHVVESSASICVAWMGLTPSPAHRFEHLGHFYVRSGHQVFLEKSLIWGHAGIPFFSLVSLPSAAGDGETAGIGVTRVLHAAAVLPWVPDGERKGLGVVGGGGGGGGDGQSRNFHEVPDLFHKRRL